jgi:hypothetical protein
MNLNLESEIFKSYELIRNKDMNKLKLILEDSQEVIRSVTFKYKTW